MFRESIFFNKRLIRGYELPTLRVGRSVIRLIVYWAFLFSCCPLSYSKAVQAKDKQTTHGDSENRQTEEVERQTKKRKEATERQGEQRNRERGV